MSNIGKCKIRGCEYDFSGLIEGMCRAHYEDCKFIVMIIPYYENGEPENEEIVVEEVIDRMVDSSLIEDEDKKRFREKSLGSIRKTLRDKAKLNEEEIDKKLDESLSKRFGKYNRGYGLLTRKWKSL